MHHHEHEPSHLPLKCGVCNYSLRTVSKLFHCLLNNRLLSLDDNHKWPLFIRFPFKVLGELYNK